MIWIAGSVGCGKVQPHSSDAPVDAPDAMPVVDAPDAMPDSRPAVVKFDVGYVNDFMLTPTVTTVFGFVAVVNMGTTALDLGTASVSAYSDDSDVVIWSFTRRTGSTEMLAPGHAAGSLTLAAANLVLANDVVAEPVDDHVLTFAMLLPSSPAVGASFHAQAVIRIGEVDATLPFTINIVAGGDVQLNSATRVSAQP